MTFRVLIIGAGIAGPALALMLVRSGRDYDITIVERSPHLRAAGQQVDLRAQGIPILSKLGLFESIKSKSVGESGVAFVNAAGEPQAVFGVNDSGKGQQALTSEYEIMRGDVVDILYNASLSAARDAEKLPSGPRLRYEFGKSITELQQDDSGVDVQFSDGRHARYDIVVGADGQSSRTRQMFHKEEAFSFTGLYLAYFSVPRTEADTNLAKVFHLPERRVVATRSGNRPVTQVYLATMVGTEELKLSLRRNTDDQKALWKSLFMDCEWQNDRLMDGLEKTTDFYAQQIGQVKMDRWYKGRVVLLGDSAFCPSPITGMGTTAAFVGAYVLAGELVKHGEDIPAALASYNETLRPFISEIQRMPPGAPWIFYPRTTWGIWFLQMCFWVVAFLRIDQIFHQLMPEDRGNCKVPEYPDLKLD
ncbi:FAD/NAD(P)-binding domain-containing protein [Hypoxylon rubiginosum]|uniref:FAD/NAD(P)-binding domain-containing protein n=1 Tax=Hypoxylon rubiginosum TaxID=110542 RepID=A0ACC0DIC3_9PEZI|nr:FAD/NAD(P)-binding domain-containing protein [Hypoxylon rubiginosum]